MKRNSRLAHAEWLPEKHQTTCTCPTESPMVLKAYIHRRTSKNRSPNLVRLWSDGELHELELRQNG